MRRRSGHPRSIEERDELAGELNQFGYRETDDPDIADQRRFYKVERWDAHELHVEALIHASNDLSKARAIFSAEKARRRADRVVAIRCARTFACSIAGRRIKRADKLDG